MRYVILSGTFVQGELLNEFGTVPPAMLPVGNKYLIAHQLDKIRTVDSQAQFTISLPTGVEWASASASFDAADVELLFLDPNLSVRLTLMKVLEQVQEASFQLLFGDGLYNDILSDEQDFITSVYTQYFYRWGYLQQTEDGQIKLTSNVPETGVEKSRILTGYFGFSDRSLFLSVLESQQNILEVIEHYSQIKHCKVLDYDEWLDFGHFNSYFKSKLAFTTQRHFNRLNYVDGFLTKSSGQKLKMRNEYHWFMGIQGKLSLSIPRVAGYHEKKGESGYEIEYLHMPTLAELYVFGNLPEWRWKMMVDSCFQLLNGLRTYQLPQALKVKPELVFEELYVVKSRNRINDLLNQKGLEDFQEIQLLSKAVETCLEFVGNAKDIKPCLMHGDFCFSNLLWNSRAERVMMIDPRGTFQSEGTESSLIGDLGYDLAKFLHSSFGFYDMIVSDKIKSIDAIDQLEARHAELNNLIFERAEVEFGLTRNALIARLVILFATMIPLHADHPGRQVLFAKNAMRIFNKLSL